MLPQVSEFSRADEANHVADVIRQLAHEIRQPLSGIESIAYHLDMVLSTEKPGLREKLERLREMVDQANWILEDALYAVQPLPFEPEVHSLNDLLSEFACGLAFLDDRDLRLTLAEHDLPVHLDARTASRILESTLHFCTSIGKCQNPVRVTTMRDGDSAALILTAQTHVECACSLPRLLDPPVHRPGAACCAPMGSLRLLVEAQGGTLHVGACDTGVLTVRAAFPLAS
jgi:hypothetical protein